MESKTVEAAACQRLCFVKEPFNEEELTSLVVHI
jgi:hypothetical protein